MNRKEDGMRRTLGLVVTAGSAQLLVVGVVMAFFAESRIPLGDWRWLVIAAGAITVLAVWGFLDWYRGRQVRRVAQEGCGMNDRRTEQ